MPDTPLVSIIVRTYPGRQRLLERSLASVARQDYDNIEVIVAEDGGDTALDVINTVQATFPVLHLPLPKQGRCAGGNAALANSSGKYVNFLDDDDEFYADHVSTLVRLLLRNPNAAAAYARSHQIPTVLTDTPPFDIEHTKDSEPFPYYPFSRIRLWCGNFLPIQSVMFKRELFAALGGFDLELPYLEDWNLWTRYLSSNEVVHCEYFTSFFRTPAHEEAIINRNAAFKQHESRAIHSQRQLVLPLTKDQLSSLVSEAIQIMNVKGSASVLDPICYHFVRAVSAIRCIQHHGMSTYTRVNALVDQLKREGAVDASVLELRELAFELVRRRYPTEAMQRMFRLLFSKFSR